MKALIVDDEIYSVRAIKDAIDWKTLGIESVLAAFDVRQAKNYIESETADIIICDIEMPNESGISFLKWINARNIDVAFIFISCHAEFSYAQEAIRLQSCGYCVKPLDYMELTEEIQKGITKLNQKRQIEADSQYGAYWIKNKEIVVQEWWKNLLCSDDAKAVETALSGASDINLQVSLDQVYFLVLIQIRRVHADLTHWNYSKALNALRNLANGIILGDLQSGMSCVMDKQVILIGWLKQQHENIFQNCQKCVGECRDLFQMDICIYIGNVIFFEGIPQQYQELKQTALLDMAHDNGVFFSKSPLESDEKRLIPVPLDLYETFDNKKFNKIREFMETLDKENILNGIKPVTGKSYGSNNTMEIILQAKTYIEENLTETVTREDVGKAVHLNTDYLCRIFKKETGQTIADYILKKKIYKAAKLLQSRNITISEAALTVGMSNLSHFSHVFKKYIGCTPKEYKIHSQWEKV